MTRDVQRSQGRRRYSIKYQVQAKVNAPNLVFPKDRLRLTTSAFLVSFTFSIFIRVLFEPSELPIELPHIDVKQTIFNLPLPSHHHIGPSPTLL